MSDQLVPLDPNNLRFTQDSIAKNVHLKNKLISVEDARDRIMNGSLKADDFPPIQVYPEKPSGITWSKDNRRLWVFRKAGLTSISVKILDKPFPRIPDQGTTDREQWARPDYFPRVRGADECVDDGDDSEDERSTSSSSSVI